MIKTDNVTIDNTGLIRVDGVLAGRLVLEGDKVYLQIKDRLKSRSVARGTAYVYLDMQDIIKQVKESR